MAITATAQIDVSTRVTHQGSNPLGTYTGGPKIAYSSALANTDISKVFADERTIASPETLDCTSLTQAGYGSTVNMATVKVIQIYNKSSSATLTVGGSTNPVCSSDLFTIGPGKCLYLDTARTVDSTHKNLLMTPSASLTYDILILGI
jgi:hypothetical protein